MNISKKEALEAIDTIFDRCEPIDYNEYKMFDDTLKVRRFIAEQYEWIDCSEPPETEKNVFICFGTANFKSVCVGHYEPSMKMWYEDHKFFASPIYDALCYCDIPDIPEKYRGEKE